MVSPSSAMVNACGIPFIGFQFASVSFIGILQLLGVVSLAPAYLSELFVLSSSCQSRRSLRSTSRGDYLIPRSYTANKQNRASSAAGPYMCIWNDLPLELPSLPRDISSSFYSLLKTFLFDRAWAESASE